ncbi:unnamed protein product [Victoria cruziana]
MSAVDYWNKLLPKTPLPSSLEAFLPRDPSQRKNAPIVDGCRVHQNYVRGTTLDQVKRDRELDFLFLEGNLKPGSKTKKLDFVNKEQETAGWPTLLTREEAQGLPFSTSKFVDILKLLAVDPNSYQASVIKTTLSSCEDEANRGESRYCPATLESMADFVVSQLETNDVRLLTYSFVNGEERDPKSRVYTVQPGVVELNSPRAVACHIQPYPYGVFYCHRTAKTKSYIVPLVAEEDGTRVMAGALCHTETSWWNPDHPSMLALGIKPGTPVCHFLSHGHFVFVPRAS